MDKRVQSYSAGIMSESPWFLEFRKLVLLYSVENRVCTGDREEGQLSGDIGCLIRVLLI